MAAFQRSVECGLNVRQRRLLVLSPRMGWACGAGRRWSPPCTVGQGSEGGRRAGGAWEGSPPRTAARRPPHRCVPRPLPRPACPSVTDEQQRPRLSCRMLAETRRGHAAQPAPRSAAPRAAGHLPPQEPRGCPSAVLLGLTDTMQAAGGVREQWLQAGRRARGWHRVGRTPA